MPDLLSHAFIAYTLCTLLAFHYDWLTPQYVTIGMAGAFIPDLAKIDLVVGSSTVAAAIDAPFDWFALHTVGGVLVAVLVGVLLAAQDERRRVFALLALGAGSHLVADALLLKASGLSSPLLWPVTNTPIPTPGLYRSTDLWPSIVTGLIALATWYAVRKAPSTTTAPTNES